MADASAAEDLPRRQVQVQAGRLRRPGQLVAEEDAAVRLVRALVLREPGVAVDAEERAAARPRIGHQVRTDLDQPGREGLDEVERRLPDVGLVARPVGLEPVAVVVLAQLGEEREQRWRERGGHGVILGAAGTAAGHAGTSATGRPALPPGRYPRRSLATA